MEQEKILDYDYMTFTGHIMSNPEVDSYNQFTREIVTAVALHNTQKVDFLKDQRNKFFKIVIA